MEATLELDAQYRAIREEAGLLDRSERPRIAVSGAEAAPAARRRAVPPAAPLRT